MLLVHSKPHKNKMEYIQELFNEIIVYSTWICQVVMANPAVSKTLITIYANIYNYLCITGILGSFFFIGVDMQKNLK